MDDKRHVEDLTRAFGGPGKPAGVIFRRTLLGGEEHRTPWGSCLRLEARRPLELPLPSPEVAQQALNQALALVYGIGPVREAEFRAAGATLAHLAQHPKYGPDARSWLRALQSRDVPTLHQGLCRWYSASHDLHLFLLGLAGPERVVFLDLESLGLSGLPLFLIGVGRWVDGQVQIAQYLARDLSEEAAVLAALESELPADPIVVSYNGKAYDWNHIQARRAYHGLEFLPDPIHVDLLFFARRRWGNALASCTLIEVEQQVLGLRRAFDVPSAYVPIFYQNFLRTGAPELVEAILAHNRQDVFALAHLLAHLLKETSRRG